jgi:cytoplasmic iron level regulating protein YaaA (DUF328/UPF0246 family)
MLIVLSPAKSLSSEPAPSSVPTTPRRFETDTAELIKAARKVSRAGLRRMMSISAPLAELNFQRFQAFEPESDDGLPAAFTFDGDVYLGLQARTLEPAALAWAQAHVRILSGLYGLLRPLDRIQPYRLEMGVRIKTRRGGSLYDFWGAKIAEALNAEASGRPEPTLVNLASQEYFGAVDTKALTLPVVHIRFLEEKDGEARVLSFFAKRARGMMARWAAEHGLERAQDLKGFGAGGYRFQAHASSETEWVFSREQPPLAKR